MPLIIILVMFIYQKVDSTETLLSCLNVPTSSMKTVSIITAALLPLNCVCLVMSVLLFRTHQKKVQKTRFNVTRSFKATLNRDTMSFLRYASATQAIIIVVYPIVILAVRMTSHHTPTVLERTLATLAYIFNWYCVLVPAVMIYAVRRHRMKRQKKIDNVMGQQVAGEEGSDYYFQLLQTQWDQEKEPKT
ncbi:unnamed protein product [Cylicocyclus nassatus]|uniref:G-protein coupled receptors family 1 profile domain-containing protein n=1 Tax=Cylicocyclus nassatus TaxID=53992 RepID=A0AA36GYC5_CYLNA|nr:unnamed protein product [Cylicocyclus nassatus]CAJ0600661.1 unnamed protein product [Cylicocyclus nassatus]